MFLKWLRFLQIVYLNDREENPYFGINLLIF